MSTEKYDEYDDLRPQQGRWNDHFPPRSCPECGESHDDTSPRPTLWQRLTGRARR